MSKNNVLTVSVSMVTDVQKFLEYGSLLCGTARLKRGKTDIPIDSKLGVISLCDGKPFNIVFHDCSDDEINKFKTFLYEEPLLANKSKDINNIDDINDLLNIRISYSVPQGTITQKRENFNDESISN